MCTTRGADGIWLGWCLQDGLSFLASLSLWWDLDPSWRKCSLRLPPPPQYFCAALPLPARRHVPFGKLRIEPSGGLWREWVSFMDSFEFPAPLLKTVAGKGWDSLSGPSLGSAEGSCFTLPPGIHLGLVLWQRDQPAAVQACFPELCVASPPAGTLGAGPDNGQGRRGLLSALWGGTRLYSVPPLWDRMLSEFLKGADARMVPRVNGRCDFWEVSRRKVRVVNGQPK